jgi:hypothetical protein
MIPEPSDAICVDPCSRDSPLRQGRSRRLAERRHRLTGGIELMDLSVRMTRLTFHTPPED